MNRAWRRKVGTTLEWAALEMVQIDAPGLIRFLENRGERHPSLWERVESELNSFAMLLVERLSDFTSKMEGTQLDADRLESVGSKERLGFVELASEGVSSEAARRCPCVCKGT